MTEPASPEPQPQTPTPTPTQNDAGTPETDPNGPAQVAEQIGYLEDEGAYVLPFGAGVKLSAAVLGTSNRRSEIALREIPRLPGLNVTSAEFQRRSSSEMIKLSGQTAIPLTQARDFTLKFRRDGRPQSFAVTTRSTLDWLGNPRLSLTWSPEEGLATSATVQANRFVPQALRNKVTTDGDLTLGLSDGKLSGALDTTITAPDLIRAHIQGSFAPDGLSATVDLTAQTQWLGETTGEGSINSEGEVTARIQKTAGELATPIPGLTFTGGTMSIGLEADGSISGGFAALSLEYADVATATATFNVRQAKLSGSAVLNLNVPGLNEAQGSIAMDRDGKMTGAFTIGRNSFPPGLPLQRGTISGTISQTGGLGFSGSVGISLGPGGVGQLMASYSEEGVFAIGASVDLEVPGLQTASFSISHNGTDFAGEGELAVDPALLAGIEGSVSITYAEGRWAGETRLGYSADNGKLAGEITVRVRQAEDDSLKVSGDGEVTAQIAPRLAGRLTATIHEEGGIDVSGEISVTEPLEMFPELRTEREILNVSSRIPLWAILVAVLRVRAGVRAGIGPGVFRDITVTGSYTIGEEGEPSFSITGEMFIPAFVEGYVGFGAGLGASVVLGSLTGGIEAMGTAGIYGAISVVPELAYENGDYTIEGVATMAAGARLKLSLNAWAEVEALWVTVWENTWELAQVTMPVGPDLGLEARMAYTFGSPVPPTLDFNTSDVDTDALITQAMPEDGPPSAGVRDAVRNEARWQGAQRAAGRDADRVPADLQAQANAGETVPAPQAGQAPGGGAGARPGGPGAAAPPGAPRARQPQGPDGQPVNPRQAARNPDAAVDQANQAATRDPTASGTVPDAQAASSATPRHPTISVAMLREPPVAMPRTRTQQRADVQAAADLVRLIARSGETTDALDNYFQQIKARFRLSKIEYIKDGRRVSVFIKINEEQTVTVEEEIQRITGPGAVDPSQATRVNYSITNRDYTAGSRSVSQSGMGVSMTADPLTPLHGQGSGPRSGALREVFRLLETQGETGSQGYIKGHLLNDNLGGAGTSRNLFPITQTANTRHSAEIEETAKTLVNDNHYWVRYKVDMNEDTVTPYVDPAGQDRVIINSTIVAELSVLKTSGAVRLVKRVSIPSRFNATRGDAGLHGKTRRELEALVEAGGPMGARAQAELTNRTTSSAEFLGRSENQVRTEQTAAQVALQRQLEDPSQTPTDTRRRPVDQADVQLSSARGTGSDLVLTGATVSALTALQTAKSMAGYPLSGGTSLLKRLESVSGLGSANAATVYNSAGSALAAHRAKTGADKDISANVGGALTALRAVNADAARAGGIVDVVATLRAEKNARDYFVAQRAGMTLENDKTAAVLTALLNGFRAASQADRVAMAAEVGAYMRGRDDLTLTGVKAILRTVRANNDSPMGSSLNNAL